MSHRNTHIYRDVAGHLRGVNYVLALWAIEPIRFDLDDAINKILSTQRPSFEELLVLITDLSQLLTAYRELRSSIDDILDPFGEYRQTEREVTTYLSLLSGERTYKSFSFSDVPVFRHELREILYRQFHQLLDVVFWNRVYYYDFYDDARLQPNPHAYLSRACNVMREIAADADNSLSTEQLLTSAVSTWLESPAVRNALERQTRAAGVRRVVEELSRT
jgi:hypothetical protein